MDNETKKQNGEKWYEREIVMEIKGKKRRMKRIINKQLVTER